MLHRVLNCVVSQNRGPRRVRHAAVFGRRRGCGRRPRSPLPRAARHRDAAGAHHLDDAVRAQHFEQAVDLIFACR